MYKKETYHFKDYPAEQIAAKLKEVDEFEAEWGVKPVSKAWRKWCTDRDYREREWRLRQSVANSIKPNINYYKENTVL